MPPLRLPDPPDLVTQTTGKQTLYTVTLSDALTSLARRLPPASGAV